jgi:speckle-type POZ protein
LYGELKTFYFYITGGIFFFLHQASGSYYLASIMEHDGTNLLAVNEVLRSVQLLKIDGYSATATMSELEFIKSRWCTNGHEWEVRFHPTYKWDVRCGVAVKLILISEPLRDKLRVSLSCRMRPNNFHRRRVSYDGQSLSHVFASDSKCSPVLLLKSRAELESSDYLVEDSLTVECTLTELRGLDASVKDPPLPVPQPQPLRSDLHQHLGELLQSKDGADVTFRVSGESFAAHRVILAARSPVFKAEFFGGMKERSSAYVEIRDIDAAVFRSMLHFIYTDMAPELDGAQDQEPEAAAAMAQHLLVAADR